MRGTAALARLRWLSALRRGIGRGRRSPAETAGDVVAHGGFGRLASRLSRRFGETVEIDARRQNGDPETVLWEAGVSADRFSFDPGVFAHPHGRVLIERWLACLPLLMAARAQNAAARGSTIVALGDCGTGAGLAFCDYRPGARLIPDPVFLETDGYRLQKAAFAADPVPWEARDPRALWRGQTSGWHDTDGAPIRHWGDLPRVRLCRLAREAASEKLIDAGLTGVVQIEDASVAQHLTAEGLMVPRLDWRRFPRWRYAVDIDGNTNAWEGLFVKLCTASPVLKVASGLGFRQWYYDGLVPWRTFVPVSADLSDLVDLVRWLRRHDGAAQEIGRAAAALAGGMDRVSETARAVPVVAAALQAGG